MWEGIVTAIEAETFTGMLYEWDGSRIEIGDFKIDLVELKDRNLVVPGAVFTWDTGVGFQFSPEIKMSEEKFMERLDQISRQKTPA